ncbi:MAG: DNA-binding protein [Gammaproteobacteria bacterium]|nr:MAG: DNA-binding protein [Gammaproteobacteria bacterium]
MSEYEFTLTFNLANDIDEDSLLDTLFGHGCDDALVGTGTAGRVALDFSREAPHAMQALESAIQNVESALPGAALIEVKPDLVGVSDIAAAMGCSRQNIYKFYVKRFTSHFPDPVYAGKNPLWHFFDVVLWATKFQKKPISLEVIEMSKVAYKWNLQLQTEKLNKQVPGTNGA